MKNLNEIIQSTLKEFLSESQLSNNNILQFLADKKFINPKSKIFLYHGTNVKPKDFILRNDYDGDDSGAWYSDLPEGYLFLTTDINEAKSYGQYIIPCELKRYDHKFFKFDGNNPSQIFDDDFGISYNNQTHFGFWDKFIDSMKSALIIKGDTKQTIITNIDNVIPRTDLSIQFYDLID
jgi:hypothetical protein